MEYPLEGLRGAEYNPRKISQDQLDKLWESIRRFGVLKPIICKDDGLIVAGHQRTKALRANGVTHAPCYVLPGDTTTYDEIRFNQLHNGTDVDHPDAHAWVKEPLKLGWQHVTNVDANWRCGMVNVRMNIAHLINKFGPWGAAVATLDGEIIHCTQYAMSCIQANHPLLIYGVATERKEEYRDFLGDQYGRFNYDSLERKTYIQTLAQLNRMRDVAGTTPRESGLWEEKVIPWVNGRKKLRGLDLFSGKGDYAMILRKKGYDIMDVELFRRVNGKNSIDMDWVQRAISHVLKSIERNGRYDYVVCDSVFNSTDCLEAEFGVATLIGALTKPGGHCFFSGRSLRGVAAAQLSTMNSVGTVPKLELLDEHGFSGLYRDGEWFYQKFHSEEQVHELKLKLGVPNLDLFMDSSTWSCGGRKDWDVPWQDVERAIRYEFELDWPEGRKIGRSEDVLKTLRKFYPQDGEKVDYATDEAGITTRADGLPMM